MFKETQRGEGRHTLMVGCIVQDHHNWASGVLLDEQMLQKGNEGLTILALRSLPGHGIIAPVVGGKEMMRTLLARCRDTLLLMSLHPAGT